MNKLKMAACGIDCNECALYNAGHDLKMAELLVPWFRERGWIEPNEKAESVQKAVQNKVVYCEGCWSDNKWCGCGSIDFRVCCEQKGINHCGKCDDFPCGPYKEWATGGKHKEAMEYLVSLRQIHKP